MAFSTTRELTTPSAKHARHTGTCRRPRSLFRFEWSLVTIVIVRCRPHAYGLSRFHDARLGVERNRFHKYRTVFYGFMGQCCCHRTAGGPRGQPGGVEVGRGLGGRGKPLTRDNGLLLASRRPHQARFRSPALQPIEGSTYLITRIVNGLADGATKKKNR